MANCSECNKKIGFLEEKKRLPNGNIVHWNFCYTKVKEREEEKKALEEKEREQKEKEIKRKKKEKRDKEKRMREEIVTPILEKYLSNKSIPYLTLLFRIVDLKKDGMIRYNDDLSMMKISVEVFCEQLAPEQYYILDEWPTFEAEYPKLKKLIQSKDLKINNSQLFKLLGEFALKQMDNERENLYKKLAKPIYARIKNKPDNTNLTIVDIVREIYRTPLDIDIDEELIKTVLNMFKISASNEKITSTLEKVELEHFESQLGKDNPRLLSDYENLDPLQFEEWLKDVFIRMGYDASVTKASGDQGADIILMKNEIKTVVQAKKYQGSVSNKAVQEVIAAKAYYDANNAMVVTTGNYTESAKELAKKANVELWDTTKLNELSKTLGISNDLSANLSFNGDFNDNVNIPCSFCGSINPVPVQVVTENPLIKCKDCGLDIKLEVTSMEETWTCDYCNTSFNSEVEEQEHEKSCSMRKL